jgi:hypothetical protein
VAMAWRVDSSTGDYARCQMLGQSCEAILKRCRIIGVERFKTKYPNVPWTGLFGAGGENETYGFEPEVGRVGRLWTTCPST